MTLNVINPDVVVTLEVKALESLKIIHPHNYKLSEDVGKCLNWSTWRLVPLYHMGPRAVIHRSLVKQRGDFIALSHIVEPVHGIKKTPTKSPTTVSYVSTDQITYQMLKYIVSKAEKISMFMATKIMYLADYNSYVQFGSTISNNIYLRMQEGPWIPTLKNIAQQLDGKFFTIKFDKKRPYFYCINQKLDNDDLLIDSEKLTLFDQIIRAY